MPAPNQTGDQDAATQNVFFPPFMATHLSLDCGGYRSLNLLTWAGTASTEPVTFRSERLRDHPDDVDLGHQRVAEFPQSGVAV